MDHWQSRRKTDGACLSDLVSVGRQAAGSSPLALGMNCLGDERAGGGGEVKIARKIARKCIATPHKLTISWLINLGIVLPAVSFAINTGSKTSPTTGSRRDDGCASGKTVRENFTPHGASRNPHKDALH